MKGKTLNALSALGAISSLMLGIIAASLQLTDIKFSLIFKLLIFALLAAAIAAFTKIFINRRYLKYEKGRIFLIYALEDKDKVEGIYNELKNAGFKPWMASKDIFPGERWKSSIENALEEAEIALAFLSRYSYNKKGFIQKELKMALDLLKERTKGISPVIPVRLDESEVPDRLKEFQYVDIFKKEGLKELYNYISFRGS